jgi:PGF-pre-PGF domain-containing protein
MKMNKQKLIVMLLVAILIVFVSLGAAAPVGTSESATVTAAKSWIGVKEVHGGNDRSGIDCSHLVYQVYNQVGAKDIVFEKVPAMKADKNYVTVTSPAPGDVVFFQKDVMQDGKKIWLTSHVGIYIGNNQFIHTDRTVKIDSISGIYSDGEPYYARWKPSESTDTSAQAPVAAANNNSSNPLIASFSAFPVSGNAPLNVSFTDSSTGATSWYWRFGDGNNSNEQNPTHTYSEAGNYTVVLTINNEKNSNSNPLNIIVQASPSQETILPVADFYADNTSGYAPLSVQFTDNSQNATSWNWNFGDGNNSTEQSPMHIYSAAGTYTVGLTAINENGISPIKNVQITVTQQISSDSGSSGGSNVESNVVSNEESSGGSSGESSHHSSSSSSSSGGGGSPEPASNVQIKEISQTFISSGKDTTFNFTKNTTCVESITFRSTKTVGKTTTIAEELKNKSSLVSKLPEGIIYRLFNIWVGSDGYGNSKSIENSSINFKVNTSWIQENNINKSSIMLDMYDSTKKEWVKLPVNLTSEDDQFLHLTANVPGYSSFAIVCTNSEHNPITVESHQTTANITASSNKSIGTNITAKSNTSAIESKKTKENENVSGFSMLSGFVCIFCIFLYKTKKI